MAAGCICREARGSTLEVPKSLSSQRAGPIWRHRCADLFIQAMERNPFLSEDLRVCGRNAQLWYILRKVNPSLFRLISRQGRPTKSTCRSQKHFTSQVTFCHPHAGPGRASWTAFPVCLSVYGREAASLQGEGWKAPIRCYADTPQKLQKQRVTKNPSLQAPEV